MIFTENVRSGQFRFPVNIRYTAEISLYLIFANPEVVDHIYEQIAAVLRQGDINYVKWDMNRSLCDIYSDSMVWQGNVMYDYMLGVYDLLERLTQAFSGYVMGRLLRRWRKV